MKFTLKIFLLTILSASLLLAQDEKKPEYGWKNSVVGDINFSQNEFDNWQAGGDNNITWHLLLNAKFENDQKDFNWANSGKFQYGKTKVGDAKSRKSIDEINIETVYTHKLNIHINPYISAKVLTQFADGFDYSTAPSNKISESFDPMFLSEAVGIGFKPNDHFKTRLGAAAKQTMSAKKYGFADDKETTDKIEDFKNEIGAESVTEVSMPVSELITFDSKLELFSNLKAIKDVDVNWDNTFSAKVAEYIKVSFNLRIFYDSDISIKRQMKHTLAVGLSYNLL